jgi:hypothetical protein
MKSPLGNRVLLITCVGTLLTILTIACSSSFPSESDGRKVLESIAANMFGGQPLYSVKSFTKTNATDSERIYELEFEADVECKRVNEVAKAAPGSFQGFRIQSSKFDVGCSQVGEVKKLKGTLAFEKTEKGWRGLDGQIY